MLCEIVRCARDQEQNMMPSYDLQRKLTAVFMGTPLKAAAAAARVTKMAGLILNAIFVGSNQKIRQINTVRLNYVVHT
jgi:hypothetical protein